MRQDDNTPKNETPKTANICRAFFGRTHAFCSAANGGRHMECACYFVARLTRRCAAFVAGESPLRLQRLISVTPAFAWNVLGPNAFGPKQHPALSREIKTHEITAPRTEVRIMEAFTFFSVASGTFADVHYECIIVECARFCFSNVTSDNSFSWPPRLP